MSQMLQTTATKQFQCLGDACEDTCCKGWGMQLSAQTVEKYKAEAPELLDAVSSGEAEFIMKRDPQTDYCVKFDAGWCGVHAKYGPEFLGDACHFFPRATRALGDVAVMTMAPSCPEAARLMLYGEQTFALTAREDTRVPHSLKNYLPEGMDASQALALHQCFMDAAAPADANAARAVMRLYLLCEGLAAQPQSQWLEAANFYLKIVDGRLMPPEPVLADPLHVLNALQGLVGAAKASNRPRLMRVMDSMADAMQVTLHWDTLAVDVSEHTAQRVQDMDAAWREFYAEQYDDVLKRYLQTQLSLALFPFGGLGKDALERMLVIAVRVATLQTALSAASFLHEDVLPPEEVVRIVQSISRFLDHLSDPEFSLKIYAELGWNRPSRLRALLGDSAA
jgi:lysine-N-methylase